MENAFYNKENLNPQMKEQDEVKEALGSEYTDYNLIMAKTMKV